MRTDEGKTSSEMGVKKDFASKRKVSAKKEDMAGRMKGKGMPYTMSTQDGSFDQSRGMKAKMWGPERNFSKGGGMPYKMWGPDAATPGMRKRGETPTDKIKAEGGKGRGR